MPRKHRSRSRKPPVVTNYSLRVTYFAYAQSSPRWREWTSRKISMREVLNLVAAGEAKEVVRWLDNRPQVVGYQATTPTSWERPKDASLNMSTLIAVGTRAMQQSRKSRDDEFRVHLTGWQRAELNKWDAWAMIGDTKAVCVRAAIPAEERTQQLKRLSVMRNGKVWPPDARQVASAA